MSQTQARATSDANGGALKLLVLEALLVTCVGLVFALLANAVSPHGLKLDRNYFPEGAAPIPSKTRPRSEPNTAATSSSSISKASNTVVTGENGLQFISGTLAATFFHDPRLNENLVVFLDARDDEHYREGHIPGAYEFDPYHPEDALPTILPLCQSAENIIVYCNGGDCEDSKFAAITLRDAGISNQKLFVYRGGISEWTSNAMPVEAGDRLSGNILATHK